MNRYIPTEIEKKIADFYQNLSINYPVDIDENHICNVLGIELHYSNHKSFAYIDDEIKIINIHKDLDCKQKRKQFFHELSHIVGHVGNQLDMCSTFRRWQEAKSTAFIRYAAMPYHMLHVSKIREYDNIYSLSDSFLIPESVCLQRLTDIKNRMRGW